MMLPLDRSNLLTLFGLVVAGLGLLSVLGGIFVLVRKTFSRELTVIAEQTVKLGEKGIADDLSGLVGNASALIDSLNQLVKTASGIGIFLILIGCLMLIGASFLLIKI